MEFIDEENIQEENVPSKKKEKKKRIADMTQEEKEEIVQKIQEKAYENEEQIITRKKEARKNKRNLPEIIESIEKAEKRDELYNKFREEYELKSLQKRKPSSGWKAKRKKNIEQLPSFDPKDIIDVELGISNVNIGITRSYNIIEKPKGKRGRKKATVVDDYGDLVEKEEPLVMVKKAAFITEYNKFKMLKKGGRLIDPSLIRNLEDEMPPNIRNFVEIPKKQYVYPEDYNGEFKFHDKIIFNVLEETAKTVKNYSVEGIIYDFSNGKFLIRGLDGEKYKIPYDSSNIRKAKITPYELPRTFIENAKQMYNLPVNIQLRDVTIQTLYDTFSKYITGMEIEKIPNIYDFGFTTNDALVLRRGIQGYDNHKASFIFLDDEDKKLRPLIKGYWNYTFDFIPVSGEKIEYSERVYVPESEYINERDMDPTKKGLFYENELQNFIYSKYKKSCIKKLQSDDNIVIATDRKFNDMLDPKIVVEYIRSYLGEDIFDKNINDVISAIDESFGSISKKEYLFSILVVDLKNGLEKVKNNPEFLKGLPLAILISNIIDGFIKIKLFDERVNELQYEKSYREERTLDVKSKIKEYLINTECENHIKENPIKIDEENKTVKFFNENISSNIRDRYEEKLLAYITAKNNLDKAKNSYISYITLEQKDFNLVSLKNIIKEVIVNKDFSNTSKKGFEILSEIKNYESLCYVENSTFFDYLKKILTPINYLKGELSNHTKFFQAKIASREFKIDELMNADIAYCFPEFSMGIASGTYEDRFIMQRLQDIENELVDLVDSVIESYLSLKYLGVRHETSGTRIKFKEWGKYIKEVNVKCQEDTGSGKNIPLKDIVVCFDKQKNLFTCSSIDDVLENIRKHDREKKKGAVETGYSTVYGDEFIEKMRERYADLLSESYIQQVPIEKKISQIEKDVNVKYKYNIVIVYNKESKSYQKFEKENQLHSLKEKYPIVNFTLIEINNDVKERYSIKKYPIVILFKNDEEIDRLLSLQKIKIENMIDAHNLKTNKVPIFEIDISVKPVEEFIEDEEIIEEKEEIIEDEEITEEFLRRISVIDIPYDDMAIVDQELLTDSVERSIKNKEISFPYARLFIENPKNFVGRTTKAHFGHKFDPNLKGKQYKKDIVLFYYDKDYENIDILSSFFTDDARVKGILTKNGNNQSLEDAWLTDPRPIIAAAIEYSLKNKRAFDTKALREGLYFAEIPECTTFKISQAIAIYNEFKPKIVFDPFAGWGDRALGAAFSNTVKQYIGTDPNSALRRGYSEIVEYVRENFKNKKVIFEHVPVEEFNYNEYFSSERPDLIFSSPPYYDYEIYSNEPTQSISRHSSKDGWTKWFHTQTANAFMHLRKGGYLVYYLGVCKDLNIPKNLINYMKDNVNDSEYMGVIPTRDASNPKKRPLYFYVWKKR